MHHPIPICKKKYKHVSIIIVALNFHLYHDTKQNQIMCYMYIYVYDSFFFFNAYLNPFGNITFTILYIYIYTII